MKKNDIPFIYRSFVNFWLLVILPSSLVTTLVFEWISTRSFEGNLLALPSFWVKVLVFQVLFGLWMYFRDYRPKSKKYRNE